MTSRTLAAVVLASALLAAAAVAAAASDRGKERRSGAIAACRSEHAPGTDAFRACLRARPEARSRRGEPARPGERRMRGFWKRGGGAWTKERSALRELARACREQGHAPRSAAFRACVREGAARQGIDLQARKERRAAARAEIRACREQHGPGSRAFRDCVRRALDAARG